MYTENCSNIFKVNYCIFLLHLLSIASLKIEPYMCLYFLNWIKCKVGQNTKLLLPKNCFKVIYMLVHTEQKGMKKKSTRNKISLFFVSLHFLSSFLFSLICLMFLFSVESFIFPFCCCGAKWKNLKTKTEIVCAIKILFQLLFLKAVTCAKKGKVYGRQINGM